MINTIKSILAGVAASTVLFGGGANAGVTAFTYGQPGVGGTGQDPGVLSGQTIVDNMTTHAPVANATLTERDQGTVAFYTSSISGVAAQPAGHTGYFEAVGTGGTATFTFASPETSVSAYLGSIDTYNYIKVKDASGWTTITGGDMLLNNYGNQSLAITNRRIFINDTLGITNLVFGSNLDFSNLRRGRGRIGHQMCA